MGKYQQRSTKDKTMENNLVIQTMKTTLSWCDKNKVVGLDIIRIYLGLALLFRGLIFLIKPEIVQGYLQGIDSIYLFMIAAHYVALAHLAGGLLLVVGLLTRISAIIQVPALIGAVFYVNVSKGLLTTDSLELSALVLIMLLVVSFFGSGPLSVDTYLENKPEDN